MSDKFIAPSAEKLGAKVLLGCEYANTLLNTDI
jgi:hypothetical protein